MTDTETLSWSSLQSINPKACCKIIKQLIWWSSDWVYEINPTGVADAEFDVYCDMTTDWGGWTLLLKAYNWDATNFYHTSVNDIFSNSTLINENIIWLSKDDYKWTSFLEVLWTDLLAMDLSTNSSYVSWKTENWMKTLRNHMIDAQDWRWDGWANWCWIKLSNLNLSNKLDTIIWNIPISHFWLMCTDDNATSWATHWDDSQYIWFHPFCATGSTNIGHHAWLWKYSSDGWDDVYEWCNAETSSDSWIAIFIK
jgi:hypothetical protein